jgi:hypothetical protein
VPERIVFVPVDLDPSNECVRVVTMAFVKGTEPAGCGRRPAVPATGPQAFPREALPLPPAGQTPAVNDLQGR